MRNDMNDFNKTLKGGPSYTLFTVLPDGEGDDGGDGTTTWKSLYPWNTALRNVTAEKEHWVWAANAGKKWTSEFVPLCSLDISLLYQLRLLNYSIPFNILKVACNPKVGYLWFCSLMPELLRSMTPKLVKSTITNLLVAWIYGEHTTCQVMY